MNLNRRFFLTLMGSSFLANISLGAIAFLLEDLTANSESQSELVFYVAPDGSDRHEGTKDAPFATLHRARSAIRELKRQQNGTLRQPVTVWLRGGTYFLAQSLELTSEDSGTENFPIIYRAYPGEKPVISGGQRITDWKQQGDIWRANLPQVKTGWNFRLLRVNDDWAIRARYPNFEPNNPLTKGWLYLQPSPSQPVAPERGRFNHGVARVHNPGDRLEWNISVPESGKYQVWLRYANNMKAYGVDNMGGRTALRLGKRNTNISIADLPDTGSFSTFRWQSVATVDLSSGKQQLVWQNLQGGGLTLDAFCLTNDLDWNPNQAVRSQSGNSQTGIKQPQWGKSLIIVHAETFEQAKGQDLSIVPETGLRTDIATAANQFPQWQSWNNAEIHILPDRGWVNAILPVTKIDSQSHTIYVNSKQNLLPGNRFFIANTREALDSPNEWYLDRDTGELLYYADCPNFPHDVDVVAPKLEQLIILKGDRDRAKYVENIYFYGLTFTDTNYTLTDNYYFPADAAIWLSATRRCVIENCNFVLLGGYGIRLEQSSAENYLVHNNMTKLGQGGVVLSGNKTTQPLNNTIAANQIYDCGKVYKHVAGIYLITGSGNLIAHNRISNLPRYGISLKSLDRDRYSHHNIIEFNEIIDTNLETNDTGAIETLGRDKQASGNIIRFNFIRNVVGMKTTQQGQIVSPSLTWGIYLDDYSSGTLVYGNIVIGTVLGGVMIHGGKDNQVENNIFIGGVENQIQVSPQDEFMRNNQFSRNIVVCDSLQAKLWDSNKNWQPDLIVNSDFNLYCHTDGLNLAKTGKAITPEGDFQQWQAAGFDLHSLVAEPPFLTSLNQDFNQIQPKDFKLKSDCALVEQLQIQAIPLESIGIEGFEQQLQVFS
ncbi:MAG TPA: right-handed parallel beta-helix repeat-containing protein [Coleofasciculaceae cyanobacterium]|jgi:parallel beta-helix repeat protein